MTRFKPARHVWILAAVALTAACSESPRATPIAADGRALVTEQAVEIRLPLERIEPVSSGVIVSLFFDRRDSGAAVLQLHADAPPDESAPRVLPTPVDLGGKTRQVTATWMEMGPDGLGTGGTVPIIDVQVEGGDLVLRDAAVLEPFLRHNHPPELRWTTPAREASPLTLPITYQVPAPPRP